LKDTLVFERLKPSQGYRARLVMYLVGGLFVVPAVADAQRSSPPPSSLIVDGIDSTSQTRFLRADKLLEAGQSREAIENMTSVIESSGDGLVAVRNSPFAERLGFIHHIPVRRHGHQWLASLLERSPAALRVYRRQIDPLAERLYRTAMDERTSVETREELLLQIVDEMFASTYGDDALFWLGELARQRGDYTLARNYWESISPALRYVDQTQGGGADSYPRWLIPPGSDESDRPASAGDLRFSTWLAYPDTDRDLAEVRLRLVVASILEGNRPRAELELTRLKRTATDRSGIVAGREGRVPTLVAEFLSGSRDWSEQVSEHEWGTFGGAPIRTIARSRPFDLGGRPIWKQPLPRLSVASHSPGDQHLRVAEAAESLLSIYPVAAHGMAIYAVGLRAEDIEAVDLQTGKLIIPRRSLRMEEEIPHLPGAPTVPRITLTVSGSTLFALTLDQRGLPARLVALDLDAEGKLVYSISLERPEWRGNWMFEGTPVSDGELLYAAVRQIDQVRYVSHVAAFNVLTGRLQWRRMVCEAETEPGMDSGYLSNLLTLDQGTLYYNSNLGAVAALRASDGVPRWLVSYPRADPELTHPDRNELRRFRDLAPCLVHRDLVIVAPRDCDRIFALDALTGTLLWATPPDTAADVVHFLGVSGNQLLASGECMYWFDLYSGRLIARFPDTFHPAPGHARPAPRGHGRGLLAGGMAYWPTREAIYVFRERTSKTEWGWQPRVTRRIELTARGASGGHLVLQDNVLLIAAAGSLYAFNETGIRRHARN
jgi:outer membrane protein assembly factor BamB